MIAVERRSSSGQLTRALNSETTHRTEFADYRLTGLHPMTPLIGRRYLWSNRERHSGHDVRSPVD